MCQQEEDIFFGIARNTLFSTVASIVSTWIVFFLGYTLAKKREKTKEKESLQQLKIYALTCLKLLCDQAIEQKKAFENLSKQLMDKENDALFHLPRISNPHFGNLKDVPPKNLYEIFVFNSPDIQNATREYGDVQTAIETLYSIKENAIARFEQFLNSINSYGNDYTNHMMEINKLYNTIHIEITMEMQSSMPYIEIIDLFKNRMNDKNARNPLFASDTFLMPLFLICNKNRTMPFFNNFLPHTMLCIKYSESIETARSVYLKHITSDISNSIEHILAIQTFIDKRENF